MLKQLRRKFIMINMAFVLLILTIVFTGICIYKYEQIQNESIKNLERIMEHKNDQVPRPPKIGQPPNENFQRLSFFIVEFDKNEYTKLYINENIDLTEDEAKMLFDIALNSGKDKGILKKYNLQYMVYRNDDYGKIGFLDCSYELMSFRSIVITSIFSFIIASIAFFIVSIYLSKWALYPVEIAWKQQQQFLADASHELKTPLTVILANMRILKKNKKEIVYNQINWIESTDMEAKRMKTLVDNLLFLAKSDGILLDYQYSNLNISDLVSNIVLSMESIAFENGISFDMYIKSEIYVFGDSSQLKQLVSILLDNAIKYANKNSDVKINLTSKQSKAILSVNNKGNIISEEDISHLFDRFYRTDKSRSQAGYGLGLSIAKSIVHTHQGNISVTSNETNGTSFVVNLPNNNKN